MKADTHESSLIAGMQAWKDHLEQSIPKAHPKRAPVNGEVSPAPQFYI